MPSYLTGRSGRNIQHQEFWTRMGFTGLAGHWPDEGVPVWMIDGFRCRVLPIRDGKHRAQIQCPNCTKWIFQGRLHQHTDTDACSAQGG